MLKSMTGFGRAVKVLPDKTITAEIKSLNGKYLDLNLRIPSVYKEKELLLRKELTGLLEVGKTDLSIIIERGQADNNFILNKTLAKNYFQQLADLCNELSIPREDLLAKILRMPDVITFEQNGAADEAEWGKVRELILESVKALNDFRQSEGAILEKDLKQRIANIVQRLAEVKKIDPARTAHIKNRLSQNLTELIGKDKIDHNRFEQELIYYLEKLDITEETVRLQSHCDYFIQTINDASSSKGKKLTFISQEIGREINTIGSKANDASMQKVVVEMKDELEKIKEQLNNVL